MNAIGRTSVSGRYERAVEMSKRSNLITEKQSKRIQAAVATLQ